MTHVRSRDMLTLVAAVVAGYIGGNMHMSSVPAEAASTPEIRANRFELTNKSGRVIAFWESGLMLTFANKPSASNLRRFNEIAALG